MFVQPLPPAQGVVGQGPTASALANFKVGDSVVLTLPLLLSSGAAATPANSDVVVVMRPGMFKTEIWRGGWGTGIDSDPESGLVTITVPKTVTDTLRRGAYAIAVRLDDAGTVTTPVQIWIAMDYTAASTHVTPPPGVGGSSDIDCGDVLVFSPTGTAYRVVAVTDEFGQVLPALERV